MGDRSSGKSLSNCTLLNGEVVFEEYVLLEVVAVPALITEQGLKNVAQAFVDAYENTSICSRKGNGFRTVEEAEILPDAVDAFGDDYGLVLGPQTGQRLGAQKFYLPYGDSRPLQRV
jgi:hypothetical protein